MKGAVLGDIIGSRFEFNLHSPEKRNGSSGLTARRSASVERCKMAVTRDWDFSCFFR